MLTARECLDECIRVCKPGFKFRDLGEIISRISLKNGCTTNKTLVIPTFFGTFSLLTIFDFFFFFWDRYYGHGINQ